MKKIKKINTICNRAAALGCVEDIQIEIKGNYDFFYEYLKMFPQRSMVKARVVLPFSVRFLLPEWKAIQHRHTRHMFWGC